MAGKKGRNLALEIGVLEAKVSSAGRLSYSFWQKGLEPTISWCKNIAYERSRRHKIDEGNLNSALSSMRVERLSRKLVLSVFNHCPLELSF